MPIYEYACTICSNIFEKLRPMSEMDDPANCPDCGSGSKRPAVGVPVVLHRLGWPGRRPSRAEAAAAAVAPAQAAPAQPRRRSRGAPEQPVAFKPYTKRVLRQVQHERSHARSFALSLALLSLSKGRSPPLQAARL